MPIQLDKILADIAEEKALHPNYPPATKKETDEAWARVGKNNKLSIHEARSIFKVLQKKYEQERTKRSPSWKLFDLMEKIHKPMKEVDPKQDDDGMVSMEEDEEYEMLEVQEEDESTSPQGKRPPASSDCAQSGSSNESSPEKEVKPSVKAQFKGVSVVPTASKGATPPAEEKKLLNTMASSSRPALTTSASSTPSSTAAAAAALHKKGITMKKTTPSSTTMCTTRSAQVTGNNAQQKNSAIRVSSQVLEVGDTIQLSEQNKRKLAEIQPAHPAKKAHTAQSSSSSTSTPLTTATASAARNTSSTGNASTSSAGLRENTLAVSNALLTNIKQEPDENASPTAGTATGINLITITSNPRVELTNGGGGGGATSSTAATVASTSTNGYSPRLEEIDFRNDIIFDAGNGPINGTVAGPSHSNNASATGGIINLGNFDNSLPPTFFKNLCNSSRHEALGLYVANVMNRLRPRSAAKLELGILRAIIDVQSDELEQ